MFGRVAQMPGSVAAEPAVLTTARQLSRSNPRSPRGAGPATINRWERNTDVAVVTMKQLLEAGVHFGHQTRRWNPKMERFIFGERNGIYIIDLQETLRRIAEAYRFVRDTVADGGTILFIGTKKQAQEPIREYATKSGMPYINERWLGGMLTNFQTISRRIGKMYEYERMRDSGEFAAMPKKEALQLQRELDKLERYLGGLRGMDRLPEAIFVLDTKKEAIAVTEANKLGLPAVAVVDTNCDPDVIDYVIPGNDDAIRAGALMCRVIADAVTEGRVMAEHRSGADAAAVRSAEEQQRVDAEQAEARRRALAEAREREARLAAEARQAGRQVATGSVPPPGDHSAAETPQEGTAPGEAAPQTDESHAGPASDTAGSETEPTPEPTSSKPED
jgi:small subunit ribosomal protein S2